MTPPHAPIMDEMFPGRLTAGEAAVGETPQRHNVCRCIPNCEIVFSVIAVSIYAFLPVLSHSGPLLISLDPPTPAPPLAHAHMLRHTRSLPLPPPLPSALSPLPPIFHSSLTHIDSPTEHVGVQNIPQSLRDRKKQKTGREEGALPDDGRHLISGAEGQAFARVSHGRTQTPHVNNAIERGGERVAALLTGTPPCSIKLHSRRHFHLG